MSAIRPLKSLGQLAEYTPTVRSRVFPFFFFLKKSGGLFSVFTEGSGELTGVFCGHKPLDRYQKGDSWCGWSSCVLSSPKLTRLIQYAQWVTTKAFKWIWLKLHYDWQCAEDIFFLVLFLPAFWFIMCLPKPYNSLALLALALYFSVSLNRTITYPLYLNCWPAFSLGFLLLLEFSEVQ